MVDLVNADINELPTGEVREIIKHAKSHGMTEEGHVYRYVELQPQAGLPDGEVVLASPQFVECSKCGAVVKNEPETGLIGCRDCGTINPRYIGETEP